MNNGKTSHVHGRVRGLLFGAIVYSLVCLPSSAVWADLFNGDFESLQDGLSGWHYDPVPGNGLVPPVWAQAGKAVLGEGYGYVQDVGGVPSQEFAEIRQAFTLPAGSVSLSFEYSPRFVGSAATFAAYLWDPVQGEGIPLVPGGPDPFFFHGFDSSVGDWGEYVVSFDESVVTHDEIDGKPGWYRVVLDLGGQFPPETPALLSFQLYGDVGGTSEVWLDNVSVQVPAPPAVVLFMLGMGTAGTMLRRRRSQAV